MMLPEVRMILCCGEALIDMVPRTLNKEEQVFKPIPGGSPYNTTIAIARLGVPAGFLGRISTDFFGTLLMKRLEANQVDPGFITRCDQHTTLAFVELEPGKEPRYAFYTEGTADTSLQVHDLPEKLPQEVGCIAFGSIAMTLEPVATTIEYFIHQQSTQNKRNGPVISFDPNIRPMMISDWKAYRSRLEKWLADSTIVKISSADLSYLYPDLSMEKAVEKILSLGPTLTVITLGEEGALAGCRRADNSTSTVTAPITPVQVVDTIGAGDTFHGAFLSWLHRNQKLNRSALVNLTEAELEQALRFANKAASLVCTRAGAEPPTKEEMDAERY
jgi:fructokinase